MRFPLSKKSLRISESAVRVFEYKTTTKHWHTRINPGDENNWYYMRTKIIVFPYTRALVSSSYTFLNTVRTRPVHEPGRIEFLIFLIFRSRTIHLSRSRSANEKKKSARHSYTEMKIGARRVWHLIRTKSFAAFCLCSKS